MLLFFYGDEPFRQEQKVSQLQQAFLKKHPAGGGLIVCDFATETSLETARQALMAQNLFAQKKCIILKNIFTHVATDEQKTLKEILATNVGDDVVIIWEQSVPRKNATLFTWLIKNADNTKEYRAIEGAHLRKWIRAYAQKHGTTIDQDAVEQLILCVGNDLMQLSQEIKKLSLYAQKRTITAQDISTLVSCRIEGDIFHTVEALVSPQKCQALSALRKQLRAGDAPQKVLAMYAYQLRTLLAVADAYERGVREKSAIARIIKAHPFVVQKALVIIQHVDMKRLLRAHATLTTIDQETKTGRQDIVTALEMFVVQF